MNLFPALSNRQTLQIVTGPESRQVFMGIYDNILLTSSGTRQKSLLICSANRGEGASTVALGIAMAVAEVWNQPVLLIDGNFSHPQVCEAFGLPDIHGLGDLLAGGQDVKSLVRDTTIPAFTGDGSRGGADQSHQYAGVAGLPAASWTESAATYPLIIIDGPSINGFPESVLYASQVDRGLDGGQIRLHPGAGGVSRFGQAGRRWL